MTDGLEKTIRGVRSRLRLRMLVAYGARGLTAGTSAALLLVAISKFVPLEPDFVRSVLWLAAAGLLAGVTWAAARPLSLFEAALVCDIHLKLKERISSAVDFSRRPHHNPLVPALIADAERHASQIRPSRDFPVPFPRELILAAALAAAAVGLYLLPPWRYLFASQERRQEFAEVRAQAERLMEIAHEVAPAQVPERNALAEELAGELRELAREMNFGTMTRPEALQRLSAIDEKIERNQEESGFYDLRRRLQEMQQALRDNPDLSQLAQRLREGDSEGARQSLEQLARRLDSGQVPVEEYESLARSLEQAASALGETGAASDLGAALSQAAAEIRAEAAGAAEALEISAEELLQEARDLMQQIQGMHDIDPQERSRALSELQAVAGELGGDTAGQADATLSGQNVQGRLEQIRERLGLRPSRSGSASGEQDSQQELSGSRGQGRGYRSAADAVRQGADSCNRIADEMESGNRFAQCRSSLSQCRRCLNGQSARSGAQGQGGSSGSGWGVGSTPYAARPSPVAPTPWRGETQDPSGTDTPMREYRPLYESNILQNRSYGTQVEGTMTGEGGSLLMVRKVDPQTGEVSYVPYFALEPTELQSLMDAVENQEIPRPYRDLVWFYFQELTSGAASSE